MFRKLALKKAIKDSEKEIESLEKKRMRSQSALMETMVTGEKPSKQDEEYFKLYTSLIEMERKNLVRLHSELNSL